jgi:hypothetical protein
MQVVNLYDAMLAILADLTDSSGAFLKWVHDEEDEDDCPDVIIDDMLASYETAAKLLDDLGHDMSKS